MLAQLDVRFAPFRFGSRRLLTFPEAVHNAMTSNWRSW